MANEVPFLRRESEPTSGREAELSALLREHEEARGSGRIRFAFVRGPAGVGKSHLFSLLRRSLTSRGVPVFEAGSSREARRPYGLFTELLPQMIEHLGHEGTASATLSSLARRLGPVLGTVSAGAPVQEERRLELYDAAGELFALSGRGCPLVLWPDLDAADPASLELFRYLAAVLTAPEARSGGLFVGAFRDEGRLPPALSEVLARVSARNVSLSGLDLEGIRAFLSRKEVAERLFEATGGHPDALEELLVRPVPPPAELFLRRLERLSAPGRRVLDVLACAAQALPSVVVEAVLALLEPGSERSAAAELDALVRSAVVTVRVVEGQPAFRFSREAERTAFLEASVPALFTAARRALGQILRVRGELSAAAALLLEVDPSGEGCRCAVQAAQGLAAQGAHEDAVRLYQRALPFLSAPERAQVRHLLSELAFAQGDARAALHHLSRARTVRGLSGPLAAQAGRFLLRLGRVGFAQKMVAFALQDPASAPRAAALSVELELSRGQPEQAVRVGEAALAVGGLELELEISLRNSVGTAHLRKGTIEAAEVAFLRNHALAESRGQSAAAAQAMVNLGVIAHRRGDRDRALSCYAIGARDGQRPVQAKALANSGSIYADSGEFELALDSLSRALQAFSRMSGPREVAHAASNLSRLYHFLGDLERAVELSDHALLRARELGDRYLEGSALLNLGAMDLDRREPRHALKTLEEARGCFEGLGNEAYAALAGALKARAHLSLGERAQAATELARRSVDRGACLLPAASVEVELCRAELSLLLGDLHGAGRSLGRAKDALLSHPDLEGPYRVYFVSSRLRLAAGDLAGAQAELARSARMLDELTQRVSPPRRTAFLTVPRRAEVLAAAEPELRLPRVPVAPLSSGAEISLGLVGGSQALARVVRQVEPVAKSNTTVLVRGESGTGKELLAEALHNLSSRKGMPLVKVNCAAMVEDLLLSELFGHEKGAFTGAVRERKGRFELADGGTIFLDEIGDISPKAQVALLRVLQEREFDRVGGTKTIKVDVRVICATNRDLESLIAQGRFRQDLYYRLKGVMLALPSLRERLEDLPALAAHFLSRVGRERGTEAKRLSAESLELLARHSWPGNVRELENVLASAAIFADGPVITPEAFSHVAELAALSQAAGPAAPLLAPARAPITLAQAPRRDPVEVARPEQVSVPSRPGEPLDYFALARERGISLKELRREVEVQCIRRALEEASGNISEAARLLRMKRSRLSQIVNAEPELKGACHGDE